MIIDIAVGIGMWLAIVAGLAGVVYMLLPPACAAFGAAADPTYLQSVCVVILAGMVGWGSRAGDSGGGK